MPWLELTLTLTAEHQPACENALEGLGALAVTLQDADAETPDEQAILEPGVSQTPLWRRVTLSALFADDVDRARIAEALRATLPELRSVTLDFHAVPERDWERAWMDRFKPMRFGRRLWVVPWNDTDFDCDDAVVVRLDPGLAFGTGTHETTALCLEWLDGLDLHGKRLIDYGCGSGVLAIAALKLGATAATGIDNDPQALIASFDNAQRNGVVDRFAAYSPGKLPAMIGDALVANILAMPLAELAPRFATLVRPGAPFAISGILDGQQDALLDRYTPWFEGLRVIRRGDWVRIDGRRRA